MNDDQVRRFVKTILRGMFNTIANKRIAVLGFAFKADTGDTRESPAAKVCRELVAENATVVVTDPQALDNAQRDLEDLAGSVSFEPDPCKAAEGAHAVVVLTDWQQYRTLDYQRIYDAMQRPAFIFDGRNMLDHEALYNIGFDVYSIGRGMVGH